VTMRARGPSRRGWSWSTGESFRGFPGAMETYRAALALVRGDAPATIDHAQRAIHRAADEDDLTRAGASALMGLALWGGGDLEAARRAYSLAAEGLRRTGYIADVLGCSITLADLRITQGACARGCAPMSRRCDSPPTRTGRCCGERRTCTWG
jgi:ATP/maltotriose-dependent transcriptional regulator MalT